MALKINLAVSNVKSTWENVLGIFTKESLEQE